MSDFSIAQAVSSELRRQIVDVLDATPESDFRIDGNLSAIALESPASTLDNGTMACLYLYHLEIDGHLRNQNPLPDRSQPELFRRPPLPLRFRFLFTPVGAEEDTNLLILGRIMQHFHDAPTFDTLSGAVLGDSHGGAPSRLRVRIETPPIADLTQLWSAFNSSLRLSIVLAVEIIAIDSGKASVETPRAREIIAGFGQTARRPR